MLTGPCSEDQLQALRSKAQAPTIASKIGIFISNCYVVAWMLLVGKCGLRKFALANDWFSDSRA